MPAQLQHMLLCLQGYDYTLHYCTLVRKWPCLMPSLTSVHILAPTSHWILPFIMLALVPRPEGSISTSLHVSDAEMCALTDIIITGWPDDIREVPHPLHPYWQHCETLAQLKMALSSMEKPSLFLHQKGREYYTNYTSSIKESPNPSCLQMDISSGLV